jgi:hypothetical protein
MALALLGDDLEEAAACSSREEAAKDGVRLAAYDLGRDRRRGVQRSRRGAVSKVLYSATISLHGFIVGLRFEVVRD